MKKLLITGFEPFGGEKINPSWEAVCRLPEEIGGYALTRLRIPVVFGQAAEMLQSEIRRICPDVVISCGVASGRNGVTPELVAINYRKARIPDNAGQSYAGEPILPGGDTAYMTRLPVNEMVAAIQAEQIHASLSLSAGAYVCNDVYYALLRSETALRHRGLFVHVPDAEVVSAQQAARALTICLETALSE